MKYPAEVYAKSLMAVLGGSARMAEAKILKSFLKLLNKNGDIGNSDKIIREIRKIAVKKDGGRFVEIESARPLTAELRKKLLGSFSPKDYIESREREELLAGARILVDGEIEVDFSFRKRLRNLFQ